jgi:hypothetical protein
MTLDGDGPGTHQGKPVEDEKTGKRLAEEFATKVQSWNLSRLGFCYFW